MAGLILKSWIVAGTAALALSACEMGTSNTATTENAADGTAAAATSVRLVDHDVEAPEVYQTSDKGLWDGRPSLGGVWVASPDAKNPERVIMRNPANGKFVIGGLFQRDASLPGPKLQLSSDAADALGLVAGQPAVVKVTALRRDESPAPAPDATKPLLDANEGAKPADVATTAAAAIDRAAADKAATTKSGKSATTNAATIAATTAGVQPAAEAKPAAQAAASTSGSLFQIGIFSTEANAKRASDLLKKAGIASAKTTETSHGKPLWSVTARGDSAMLAKIKSAGFTDAYVLGR
ncbi:MAG: SPOR domain-containing protein [Cypionkella sp.]